MKPHDPAVPPPEASVVPLVAILPSPEDDVAPAEDTLPEAAVVPPKAHVALSEPVPQLLEGGGGRVLGLRVGVGCSARDDGNCGDGGSCGGCGGCGSGGRPGQSSCQWWPRQ